MILVFIGAPGAGKGTQAQMLTEKGGYRQISTGEALRKHVREESELGKKVKAVMDRGELVSDDILLQILREEVGNDQSETIILDGYPRNLEQAKTLQSFDMPHEIAGAVLFDIDKSELVERLTGRRVCENCGANYHVKWKKPQQNGVCDQCSGNVIQRSDDTEEKVKTRLDVYEQATKPVIDFYRNINKLHALDGSRDMKEVNAELEKVLTALN